MSSSSRVVHGSHDPAHGTLASYATGFVLSIFFTLYAYIAAVGHKFSGKKILAFLLGLALLQFLVQLWFFLHVGRETKPRWRQLLLILMIFFALVVVLGSIWVMYNLNYRMTPQQVNQYMSQQAGEGF